MLKQRTGGMNLSGLHVGQARNDHGQNIILYASRKCKSKSHPKGNCLLLGAEQKDCVYGGFGYCATFGLERTSNIFKRCLVHDSPQLEMCPVANCNGVLFIIMLPSRMCQVPKRFPSQNDTEACSQDGPAQYVFFLLRVV